MTPDDKQLIDSLREKANGMFGETYALLMRAADRLAELTDTRITDEDRRLADEAEDDAIIREIHRTEHEVAR